MSIVQAPKVRKEGITSNRSGQAVLGFFFIIFGINACTLQDLEKDQNRLRYPSRLSLFQVGQGDAIAVWSATEPGVAWLTDAGPANVKWDSLAPQVGLTQVRGLFLTHTDADHIGGVLSLLIAVPVEHIYLPSRKIFSQNTLGRSVLELASAMGIPVDTVTAGMKLELAAGLEVKALWPPADTVIPGNDGSLVTYWTCGNATVLMTGDAGFAVESALLSQVVEGKLSLRSDLLKVAHHGSRTASYSAFLNQVQPVFAVISCDSAVYGHPHSEAMARLNQVIQNANHIFRTDREGTLWFEAVASGGWARFNSTH